MESHSSTLPPQEPLPRGMACPACSYDLSGAAVHRCSECGRAIQERDVGAFRARLGAAEAGKRLATVLGVSLLVVATVVGIAIRVLTEDVLQGFVATVVVVLALGAPMALGWWAAVPSPRPMRAAWRLAWLRSISWVHVSWVSMLVLAGAAIVVARMVPRGPRGGNGDLAILIGAFVLFLVWIGFSIFGFASGEERWQRQCDAMGLWDRWPRSVYTVLMGLTIVGSILLGLVVGCALAGGFVGIR